jgi:5-methylcytosine-specific restriction protein A
MALKDLTRRKAVLDAIREYDLLGQERFLTKYRFGKARIFHLIYKGKYYDSKAIVGAAHGFQFKTPLYSFEFSGGLATVVPKLKSLGFETVANVIKDLDVRLPEEVPPDIWEGAKQKIYVNKYERSAEARTQCIEAHGSSCKICKFDFGAAYGKDFHGFIHVHHITPISTVGARYKIDPVKDLMPVCPNCHSILHYGNKHRTPEQVRKLMIGKK